MKIIIKAHLQDDIIHNIAKQLNCLSSVTVVSKIEETETDAVCLITTSLSPQELSRLPRLKAIFLYKTGLDDVPVEALKKKNILLFPSHINSTIVAEHALTLALALLHRINEFHENLKDNIWFSDGMNYLWRSLTGLRVGILGYGHIGREVARLLAPFGGKIFAYNRHGTYSANVVGTTSIKELIEKVELIFCIIPKNLESVNMVNEQNIDWFTGKIIVNVGRAEIFQEETLFKALQSGRILGLASDVWYRTPDKKIRTNTMPPANYPFSILPNVLMSPHTATHAIGAHERYIRDAVEQCEKFLCENLNKKS